MVFLIQMFLGLVFLLSITHTVQSASDIEEDLAQKLSSMIPRPLAVTRFGCRRQVRRCRKQVGDSLPFSEWYAQADQLQNGEEVRNVIEKSESADYGGLMAAIRDSNLDLHSVRSVVGRLKALPKTLREEGLAKAAQDMAELTEYSNRFLQSVHGNLRRLEDNDSTVLQTWIYIASVPFTAIRLLYELNPLLVVMLFPFLAVGVFTYFMIYSALFMAFYPFFLFGRVVFGGAGNYRSGGSFLQHLAINEDCVQDYLQCQHELSLSQSIPALIESTQIVEANAA